MNAHGDFFGIRLKAHAPAGSVRGKLRDALARLIGYVHRNAEKILALANGKASDFKGRILRVSPDVIILRQLTSD